MQRRKFVLGSLPIAWSIAAEAQPRTAPHFLSDDSSPEVVSLRNEAADLGFVGPQAAAAGASDPLELARMIAAAVERTSANAESLNLAKRAGLLLSENNALARDGVDYIPTDTAPASVQYSYSDLKGEYARLYRSAKLAPEKVAELRSVAQFIHASNAKAMYQGVRPQIPWFLVGAIHYREASLNFLGHLHNGDPLYMQTVHVPANRPPLPWVPDPTLSAKQLWRLSAQDAVRWLPDVTIGVPGIPSKQWAIERICYALESYNGFGCRQKGIHTPYLWNYTNQYSSGGFYADHKYSPSYKSKQAGLIAIIKALESLDPASVSLEFDT